MLERMVASLKESTGHTIRLTSLALVAGAGLFVTTSFLCAAAFVAVFERHGLVAACLTGAAIFFVVTLIAMLIYMVGKRSRTANAARPAEAARSAAQSTLADPILLASGLQLMQMIGVKRLIPILAIGGIALGLLARGQMADNPDPAE
ncbi:heme/copper-type cytochrome/quinol oxidase subunit 2 [Bradyrhizobium sp. USDA 4369]